jgi:hypothetical protein
MPTQAELDKEQNRVKSRSGTIGKIDLGGGVYDLNTRPDDNKEGTDERIANDGIDTITSPLKDDDDSSSGSGLPEYPGDEPSNNVKAPLIWDGNNNEARWLQGTTQSPTDENTYVDVFGYDPEPSSDKYSLFRMEYLEVIICKDGEPVTGNIFFAEAEA